MSECISASFRTLENFYSMRSKLCSLLIFGTVLFSFIRFSGALDPENISSVHPRLYCNETVIHGLKSRLQQAPYSTFWLAIKTRADSIAAESPPSNLEGYGENKIRWLGDRLPFLAMSWLLTQEPLYLEKTREWMNAFDSYPNWGQNGELGAAHLLRGMAIAYDWLYAEWTTQERESYRQKIAEHASILAEALAQQKKWWAKNHLQNHNYHQMLAIATAGLALYGEHPEALDWLETSERNFEKVLTLLSPDGAYHEGVSYWSYGIGALLKYVMLMEPVSGLEDARSCAFLQNTARFRLYASLPGYQENVDFADSRRTDNPGGLLRALARIFRDEHAQWLAERIEMARQNDGIKISWTDLLFYDESVPARAPDDLPLHAHFENLGIFISRSDWSDDASWLFFKAGPPLGKNALEQGYDRGTGHVHPDAGNVLLWAHGGWMLIDDGYPKQRQKYYGGIEERSENHNVLLMNGLGQAGADKDWKKGPVDFDFGWKANITYSDVQPRYAYLVAELGSMYPEAANVTQWTRTLVSLEHGYLVIRDEVELRDEGQIEAFWHVAQGMRQHQPAQFLHKKRQIGLDLQYMAEHRWKEELPGEPWRPVLRLTEEGKSGSLTTIFRPFKQAEAPEKLRGSFDNTIIRFHDALMRVEIDFEQRKVDILPVQ